MTRWYTSADARVRPALLALLLACAVPAPAQVAACSPDDAAAERAIRGRLAAWVAAANAGDRAGMRGVWAPGVVGWSPRAPYVSDSAAYAAAGIPYRGNAAGSVTYELVVDDAVARGDVATVHDIWTEIRRLDATTSVQRTIRGSELWRCQDDGQWRIVRYVSAMDPWIKRQRRDDGAP